MMNDYISECITPKICSGRDIHEDIVMRILS